MLTCRREGKKREDKEGKKETRQKNKLRLRDVTKTFCGQQHQGKGYVVTLVLEVAVQDECLLPIGGLSPDHHNRDQNHPGNRFDGLESQRAHLVGLLLLS